MPSCEELNSSTQAVRYLLSRSSHLYLFPCLDVHWPVQTAHGLVPERLQRGHVGARGASGLSGEGPVQVRSEWPKWLPELGEGPGLTTDCFQSGSQLPQEEDD